MRSVSHISHLFQSGNRITQQNCTAIDHFEVLCHTRPARPSFQKYAVMGDKEEILLNSRQAAEILDLSPDTVNELARKHTLPGIKRGRQWRFRRRDIVFFKKHLQEQVAA